MEEFDAYAQSSPKTYAEQPSASPTLSLIIGANGENVEEVDNQQRITSPSVVAAQRALKERQEDLQLLKESATGFAIEGNIPAVEATIKEIQSLGVQPEKPSFVDDTQLIARNTLERLMAQTGRSAEEIITYADFYSKDLAIRSAIEVAISSLNERGGVSQFARDITGITTIKDWGRVSPILNEFNELYGYDGPRALTLDQSVQNTLEMLKRIDTEDRPKVIGALLEKLVPILGEEDTRRVFETMNEATRNPAIEAIFGTLDGVGIGLLLKGALKGVLSLSRPIMVAKDIGRAEAAAKDAAKTLVEGKSVLGVSTDDAVGASTNFNIWKDIPGLSGRIQEDLRARMKAVLDDIDNTLYSGGATTEELLASKRTLENLYNNKVNTSIVSSNITADVNKGRLLLDVVYGDRQGNAFDTAEEALDYYKNLKRDNLEVVPVSADNSKTIAQLDSRIKELLSEINIEGKKRRIIPAEFAQEIVTNNAKALDTIQTVLNKKLTKQPLAEGIETIVGRAIGNSKTVEEAAQRIQKLVPENMRVKLRELEDAVEERVVLSSALPKKGFYLRQKTDRPVFVKDIGAITADEFANSSLMLGKLSPRLGTASSIYGPGFLSTIKRDKIASGLAAFISKSFDKLNAAQVEKVNNALIKTEALKRDMTPSELATVNVTSDAEVEAYYAFRKARDMYWHIKEKELHDDYVSRGFQNVFVGMGDDKLTGPAKNIPLDSLIGKRAFVVADNKFVTVTTENLKQFQQYVAYEYAHGQSVQGFKSSITKVIVDPNKVTVGDLMSVVGREEGAYSRIYVEPYFIKLKGKVLIDDELVDVKRAFRTASDERSAAKYVDGFKKLQSIAKTNVVTAADVKKALGSFEDDAQRLADDFNNGLFNNQEITFDFDRTEGNYSRNIFGIGGGDMTEGRVFWSGRGENAVKSISTGSNDAVTLGPLESLQAELNNTARFAAFGEYRRNAIQRWYNTFEDLIDEAEKAGNADAETVFFRFANRADFPTRSDKRVQQMFAQKEAILSQLAIRNAEDLKVEHALRSMVAGIGKDVPVMGHVRKWLAQADLPQYLKSINSTLMLGMFNVSQLLVQANGALLAASISPKHGLSAMYNSFFIVKAMSSQRKEVIKWWNNVARKSGAATSKDDDFVRILAALDKTGFTSNIRTSSIYTGGDAQLKIFGRSKGFNEAQMMFFNTGEEVTRVVAFEIARKEFIEQFPEALWDSGENLAKIVQRADDLTLNMTKANEARWQQGWAGLPLQFLQHPIRLGVSMTRAFMPGRGPLSAKETYQLVFASYFLYGINNNATPDFLEEYLGEKLNAELTKEQKLYLTQGALSGVLYSLTEAFTGEGTSLALGSRLSSLQWYEDVADAMINVLQTGQIDANAFLGPTGSTLSALWEIPAAFRRYLTKDELTAGDFLRTVSESVSSVASTWRNVEKAYWAYHANGVLYNKRSEPIAVLNSGEIIAQALGFTSTEAWESNYVYKINKEYNKIMDRFADDIMYYKRLSAKAYLSNDKDSELANARKASDILMVLPYADQQAILSRVRERATGDTVLQKATEKWIANMSSRTAPLMSESVFGE